MIELQPNIFKVFVSDKIVAAKMSSNGRYDLDGENTEIARQCAILIAYTALAKAQAVSRNF